jgi:hypothetical protein
MNTNIITFHTKGRDMNALSVGVNILPEDCFLGLSNSNLEARMKDSVIEVFPREGIKAIRFNEFNLKNINGKQEYEDGSISFSLSATTGKIGFPIGFPYQYRLYLKHPRE